MNALRKLMLAMTGVGISIGVSILVGIKGWGLTPRSWLWLTAGTFVGQMVAQFFVVISQED